MKLFLIILFIFNSIAFGQLNKPNSKAKNSEIKVQGDKNIIKVYQGDNIEVYNLDDEKQINKLLSYLTKFPVFEKILNSIYKLSKETNRLTIENNEILKNLIKKSQYEGVLEKAILEKKLLEYKKEIEELTDKVSLLQKNTTDLNLKDNLLKAKIKLKELDYFGFENVLENFILQKEIDYPVNENEITQTAYILAIKNFINFEYKKSLVKINFCLKHKPDNYDYIFLKAKILLELSEYEESILLCKTLLNIAVEENNLKDVYVLLGINYREKGDFGNSIKYFFNSIDKSGINLSQNEKTYNSISLLFIRINDFENAILFLRKALEIDTNFLKDSILLSYTYNHLGIAYSKKNINDSALYYTKKSLFIRENIYGNSHPLTATNYMNLGTIYSSLNEFKNSRTYYNKAYYIRLQAFGMYSLKSAEVLNNIGGLLNKTGEFDSSLFYLKKSLEIQLLHLNEDDFLLGNTLQNIGGSYFDLKKMDSSLYYFKSSLTIHEKYLDSKSIIIGRLNSYIGSLYHLVNQFSLSNEYLLKGIVTIEKTLGTNTLLASNNYETIGKNYLMLGDLESGYKYLNKNETFKRTYKEKAYFFNEIGIYNFSENRFQIAIKLFEKALEELSNDFQLQDDVISLEINHNLLQTFLRIGDKERVKFYLNIAKLKIKKFSNNKKVEIIQISLNKIESENFQ